jgi:hypothetical protein
MWSVQTGRQDDPPGGERGIVSSAVRGATIGTDWKRRAFRVACCVRVLCANAFRISSSNSSSTTKSCVCPFTSISFLAGIISRSADSNRPMLKETDASLTCSASTYVRPSKPTFWSTYQNGRCQSASAFQHYTFERRGTWSNGNILEVPVRVSAHRTEWYNGNTPDLHSECVWLKSSPEGQLSRILRGFPLYLQARTVCQFRSITLFTSQSHIDAKGTVWDADSHAWISKKEVTPPGLQTIPTEMVPISRNLLIRIITKDYGETSFKCLISNPNLLIMHDFKASFTAM